MNWNQPFYGKGEGRFLSFRWYTNYVQVQILEGTSLDPLPPKASKQPPHPRAWRARVLPPQGELRQVRTDFVGITGEGQRSARLSGAFRADRCRHRSSLRSMMCSWDASRGAFADAAEWFVRTAALVDNRWNDPGLGEWDVRALVGHTSRSLLTVETYLDRPAAEVEVASAAEYFRATRAAAAGPAVAARGREAGAALGSDPATAVADIAARVLRRVDMQHGSELVMTIAGGMRLESYLPTRTFELVVHTADLATALGLSRDVPASAGMQALHIVADLAVADGLAGPLLLAATGRPGLPEGFSVL